MNLIHLVMGPASDPNEGQNRDMHQSGQAPVPNSSTSAGTDSDTDGPGDNEPQNSCPEPVLHDNLSSGESIINGCSVLVLKHMDRILVRYPPH